MNTLPYNKISPGCSVILLVTAMLAVGPGMAYAEGTDSSDQPTKAHSDAARQGSASANPSPDDYHTLPPVNVTDRPWTVPGQVNIDTRQPEQPARLTDGASLLKEIPNMSVVRKGQQSGDPVFRGLGGSRLAITANDQFLYGGCGIRMDTPTAYINPQSYDELQVIKGPQTVLKGPGLVAGAVEFIRHPKTYSKPSLDFEAGISAGSFNYYDGFADLSAGNSVAALRTILTASGSDDYEDGSGNKVRSWYKRKSASLNLAVTPTSDLRFELFGDANRSKAKFASLQLDAGKIDRNSFGGKAEIMRITPVVRKITLEAGQSHQDIIMGRQFRGLMAGGNPDRITRNGKASAELNWADANHIIIGADWFSDEHRARRAYTGMPRSKSESSHNLGLFAENTMDLGNGRQWVAGLRHDRTRATAHPGFWNSTLTTPIHTRYNLMAGFSRYEFGLGPWRNYAGLGYTERAPDFWERNRNRDIRPEKSLQLDIGTAYTSERLRINASAFANRIDDYILVETDSPLLNDLAANSFARNIDALRYGFELGAEYVWDRRWKLGGDLAYTWGRNRSDGKPLGQIPPLEGRLRAGYDTEQASLMATLRFAARQSRVAVGQGNVNGVDIGETPGFAVFGIHGYWRFSPAVRLSFGVDNLFNRLYAEHLTKAMQTPEFYNALGINPNAGSNVRINEPGRSLWARIDVKW